MALDTHENGAGPSKVVPFDQLCEAELDHQAADPETGPQEAEPLTIRELLISTAIGLVLGIAGVFALAMALAQYQPAPVLSFDDTEFENPVNP